MSVKNNGNIYKVWKSYNFLRNLGIENDCQPIYTNLQAQFTDILLVFQASVACIPLEDDKSSLNYLAISEHLQ